MFNPRIPGYLGIPLGPGCESQPATAVSDCVIIDVRLTKFCHIISCNRYIWNSEVKLTFEGFQTLWREYFEGEHISVQLSVNMSSHKTFPFRFKQFSPKCTQQVFASKFNMKSRTEGRVPQNKFCNIFVLCQTWVKLILHMVPTKNDSFCSLILSSFCPESEPFKHFQSCLNRYRLQATEKVCFFKICT